MFLNVRCAGVLQQLVKWRLKGMMGPEGVVVSVKMRSPCEPIIYRIETIEKILCNLIRTQHSRSQKYSKVVKIFLLHTSTART